MGFRNVQGQAIDGGGVLQSNLNLNSKNLTNGGDITAAHANGYMLENAASSNTNPTIIPDRAAATSGFGHSSSRLQFILGGVQAYDLSATNLRTNSSSVSTTLRGSISNDTGDVVVADDLGLTTTCALTAGTMTATSSARVRQTTHVFSWTNAMVTALGANLTGDITVCTLPAKTVVKRAFIVIDTAAAGPTTLTVAVGRAAALYIDYVVASDAKAAANTVYGDAIAEVGTNLQDSGATAHMDDMPSYTGTTAIKAHFIATVANLDQTTTSTGRIILITETLA